MNGPLFHALPVFFSEYCHKLCIQRQMVVRWKHVSYFLYWKYLKNNSFIPCPHWIKFENFVMQLKRQSVEAWQNEKHYSKENNTSENPIPRQTSRPCEVRRSGQVTTFVCAVFSLSFQAVVLLTKTAINHRFFSQSSLRWVDGFEKFRRFWVQELLLCNRTEAFSKILVRSRKMHHVELHSGISKSSK